MLVQKLCKAKLFGVRQRVHSLPILFRVYTKTEKQSWEGEEEDEVSKASEKGN